MVLTSLVAAAVIGSIAFVAAGWRNAIAAPTVRRLTLHVPHWQHSVSIAFFSDVHVHGPDMPPSRVAGIVKTINSLHPDIVISAGDFIGGGDLGGERYSATDAIAPFAQLSPKLGFYAVLGNDILVKVDRAAMSVSLETRAPFLDRDVVEFAWRLPFRMKIRDGETKWVVRRLLDRLVPKELIERPKMGFGVPVGEWLRGPLRDWAEALLDPRRLREEGFFRPEPIEQLWQAHLRGTFDEQYRLWGILMFQSWLEDSTSDAVSLAQPSPAHSPAPARSRARAAPSPTP